MKSHYELVLVEKKDVEVAVLEQDLAPLDLSGDLKCVLVALLEYVFIIE